MAINPDRPVITYENVALFQSNTPAHNLSSNNAQNLSFLPLVQGIEFSTDIQRTNVGALGTKDFIDQSNRNAPDVQFSINTIENFSNLFSNLISGSTVNDNLNLDRNFYAYIAPKRGFDAKSDRIANDVRYFSVENLTAESQSKFAVPYSGTTIFEENFDGTERTVIGGPYTEPTGVHLDTNSGKVYYGDKPIHAFGNGVNNVLIPFHLSGKQFGFVSTRFYPNIIFAVALEDNTTINVIVGDGQDGTPTYTTVKNAGEIATFEDDQEENTSVTYFINSDKNILCSKKGDGDKMLLSPVETDIYRRKASNHRDANGDGVTVASTHHVFDHVGAFANDIADSQGSDACGHIGFNKLTKYQAFAAAEQGGISSDFPNWTVVAPYSNTDVSISYYENGQYTLWSGFNLDGSKSLPAVNFDFDPLVGKNLWKMESTQPVAFFINDDALDEEMLIGWNDESLPQNKESLGQFLSFGNCFLNNVSVSQSTNGLVESQYSFVASNFQAQESNPHNVGFNDLLYTGMSVPSIDLTGAQTQNLTTDISGIDNYYSNTSDNIIPSYSTNVTISGSGSIGNFLIKSDSIQSFDLNLSINRKTINSLGKKYPVKRKALFPSAGIFSFSNLVSSFELSGARSNLKDFLSSDEDYSIDISGKNIGGDEFGFEIQNAKLISQRQASSIEGNTSANLEFSFELNNLIKISLLNKFKGATMAYSLRKLNSKYLNGQPDYVIQVKRTDNQTQSFTADEITDGTLLSFVGTGASDNGFVTIWYDQSGGERHATDNGHPPKIVDAGELVTRTINGKETPSIKYSAGTILLHSLTDLSADGQQSLFLVADNQVTAGSSCRIVEIMSSSTNDGTNRRPLVFKGSGQNLRFSVDDLGGHVRTQTQSNFLAVYSSIVQATTSTAGTHTARQNGNGFTGGPSNVDLDLNSTISPTAVKTLGRLVANNVGNFFISEVIYYPSDQTTNVAAIETDMINHYNTA